MCSQWLARVGLVAGTRVLQVPQLLSVLGGAGSCRISLVHGGFRAQTDKGESMLGAFSFLCSGEMLLSSG